MLLLEAKRSPSNGSAAKNCSVTGSDKSRRPTATPVRLRRRRPARRCSRNEGDQGGEEVEHGPDRRGTRAAMNSVRGLQALAQ